MMGEMMGEKRDVTLPLMYDSQSDGFPVESKDIKKNEASQGKSSLAGASFVQVHNAIGTGLLLFPYTFWAFGGLAGGALIQVVRGGKYTFTSRNYS